MPKPNDGRPLRLNTVISTADDGTPVTIRSAILDWLRQGLPMNTSIAHAGISRPTMNAWLVRAAAALEAQTTNPNARLTPADRDLIVFARQVDQAVAEAEARYRRIMDSLATGGLTKRSVAIKTQTVNGAQVEVERTQKIETTLPSFGATKWILEETYGAQRSADELADAGVLSDAEAAKHLGDAMEAWLSIHDADAPTNEHSGNGST